MIIHLRSVRLRQLLEKNVCMKMRLSNQFCAKILRTWFFRLNGLKCEFTIFF